MDATYRNDHWTLKDELALGGAGDQLARMVLEVEPPFTVGVTGKWGAGKTSVMRRAFATLGGMPLQQALPMGEPMREEIDDVWEDLRCVKASRREMLEWSDDHYEAAEMVRCVWFSPWQHQNEGNPVIPLLKEIQAQFSIWSRLKGRSKEVNRRGGLAGLKLVEHLIDAAASVGLGKGVSLARGASDAVRNGWNEAEPDLVPLSDGQRFHLLFEDAVKELLAAGIGFSQKLDERARLVIFVDDLDRCEESVIVQLLEAIKLYLGSRRCVFVLGLDDSAVMDALGRHWKRADDLNREYLEKLFQGMLPVPLPADRKVAAMVEAQLTEHGVMHAASLADDVESFLEPNPRKVKNFVNGLCAAWAMLKAGDWIAREEEARRFALFHYLRLYHRPVWRLLERQPKALHLLHNQLNQTEGPDRNWDEIDDPEEQRLMEEFFFRAFSHVLKHRDPEDHEHHGRESLEAAVDSFLARQDRKRSDEQFRRLFLELVRARTPLDNRYLRLDG